jgi:hypothetical protein
MYEHAVARWRRFEALLQFLHDALESRGSVLAVLSQSEQRKGGGGGITRDRWHDGPRCVVKNWKIWLYEPGTIVPKASKIWRNGHFGAMVRQSSSEMHQQVRFAWVSTWNMVTRLVLI